MIRVTPMEMKWVELPRLDRVEWRSSAGAPAPADGNVVCAGDGLSGADAIRSVRLGQFLLCTGRYGGTRQLLTAIQHRAGWRRQKSERSSDPAAIFRAERCRRAAAHALLARIVVLLDGSDFRPRLAGAPALGPFGQQVWGPMPDRPLLVPLREWVGALGAREWYRKGIDVPALGAKVHPHYGVFPPTRGDYLELVAERMARTDLAGKVVFDIGTGTGVIALILARRGAARVVATDADGRAVACARENAERLGFGNVVDVCDVGADDPFPPGAADVVVCNPPWLPGDATTLLDRAVYDPGSQFLGRFLEGVGGHLGPAGQAWLILSDLAERLRLRLPNFVEQAAERSGLAVLDRSVVPARQSRFDDRDDALHAERSRETIALFVLGRSLNKGGRR